MAKIILLEEKIDGINIKYSVSKAEPCLLNALIINDVPTSMFLFGKIKDVDAQFAPDDYFGCMNRRFLPYSVVPKANLDELKITKADAQKISAFIQKISNRGKCDFCVKKIEERELKKEG